MAIKVLGIHHHAVRIDIGDEPAERFRAFYADVLGLAHDTGRPDVPGVPGYWINVGDVGQIHLIGGEFPSPVAKGPGQDPAAAHVAFAVEDIAEAKGEIERLGVPFWSVVGIAGPQTEQVFINDPSGNMIELHQYDQCRCAAANRQS